LRTILKKSSKLDKNQAKDQVEKIIKKYLSAEIRNIDVWSVDVECYYGGGIKKVNNDRGVNRLESIMTTSETAKRMEILARTKKMSKKPNLKSKLWVTNQLAEREDEIRKRTSELMMEKKEEKPQIDQKLEDYWELTRKISRLGHS